MDVTKLPFNEFIGIKNSDNSHYLLMLDDKPEYRNHLNTVHASAQFALAEATSGYFLLQQFAGLSDIVPVVRKVETKYRKPTTGVLYSAAKLLNIEKEDFMVAFHQKRRALLNVEISLFNTDGALIMQSVFEWFIAKK